jgi:outer membrane biosynthesis protein TonB
MDRIEKTGFGVAAVGHILLIGLLSLSLTKCQSEPPKVDPKPIEVSLADDVGLKAQAPQSVVAPAQSSAPELGKPEDAPPPAKQEAKQPEPVPPAPQPKAEPPPKPAPKAPPEPKKQAPPVPDKTKAPPKREATAATKANANAKAAGSDVASTKKRQRGSLLGPDFEKELGAQPSKTKSPVPQAATMSAQAMMDIGSKITQLVQPCANRQVKPGPGAERIRVTISLHLNRDGSLAANPEVVAHDGVDDENRRYQDRVDDNAIATFKGCSPLRGLPPELYDVPRGWNNFVLRYKLPG